MMRTLLVCFLALSLGVSMAASAQPRLSEPLPGALLRDEPDLRRTCLSSDEDAVARCAAYFHGALERIALPPAHMDKPLPCRSGEMRREDLAQMVGERFLGKDYPHTQLVTVPCPNAPDFWSNVRLRDECRSDLLGPCRYFIEGVIRRAALDGRVTNRRHYCMKGLATALQPSELLPLDSPRTVPEALSRWMRAHPGHGAEPAATGLVDALGEAYPCAEGKWVYLQPGEQISGGLRVYPVSPAPAPP
jgi:hypothetical protein